MERNSGRYNSYNNHNNRRSGGGGGVHQSSSQTSNNNQQHLDNHHHHHPISQQQQHHHRNATGSSLSSSTNSSNSQFSVHSNNNTNITTSTAMSALMPTFGRESVTQHDELIRYIKEAWTKVSENGTPVVYRNDSDSQLKNFKPFNLEEYWGQRLVQNIHVSHGHQ